MVWALGEFLGLALHVNRQDTHLKHGVSRRWSPSPLLYASAAVHLGAAAAALARPRAWPWALGALVVGGLSLLLSSDVEAPLHSPVQTQSRGSRLVPPLRLQGPTARAS